MIVREVMAEWRRFVVGSGFLAGAAVGGLIGWTLGYYAWNLKGGGLLFGLLFFASFILMLFGLVAPLTLVRYFGDRAGSLGNEPGDVFMVDSWAANYDLNMALGRQLGTAAGYVAIVVFYLALAGVGALLFAGGARFHPLEVLAVFDAAGGVALGGIAGDSLMSRWWPEPSDLR